MGREPAQVAWLELTRFMEEVMRQDLEAALREHLLGPRPSAREERLRRAFEEILRTGPR